MAFSRCFTTLSVPLIFVSMMLTMHQAGAMTRHKSRNNKTSCLSAGNYDFSDSTLLQDEDAFKATFMRFSDEMQHLSPVKAATLSLQAAKQVSGIDNPYKREKAYRQLDMLAQEILADTLSPRHNILLHSIFTKTLNLTFYADMAQRNGNTYMEKNLRKNMPGMLAADFAFIDRNGKRHTLHNEKAVYMVLFFYDPDCHVCHDIARQLAEQKCFTDNSNIKVIAIYTDNETERWKAHASGFPKTWTDGYSPNGEMAEKQIFYLPVIPSLYLLDADKRVLLRDVSPETLASVVKQLQE